MTLTIGLGNADDECGWTDDWAGEEPVCARPAAYLFTSAVNGSDFPSCVDHAVAERTQHPQWIERVRSLPATRQSADTEPRADSTPPEATS